MRVNVKLGTIVNSILAIKRQLDEALTNPPHEGAELWQTILPIVGFSGEERIRFDADEVAIFIAAGANDYAEALLLLAQRHAVHATILGEYTERRERLREAMPPPTAVVGTTGQTHLSREEMMRVRPMMVAMNTLLEQLIAFVRDDAGLAVALARDYGKILRPYFGDPKFPAFVVPEGDAELMAARSYEPRPA